MLSKAEIGRLQALRRRKIRAETGLFLAEGIRVVEDLLASSIVLDRAFISPSLEDSDRGRALAHGLRATGHVAEVTDRELGMIAGTDQPQGVVVVAGIPHVEFGEAGRLDGRPFVVVDAVQDPGNFGTIVRCADAFAAAAVIVLPGTVDPWNPKSVRAAAGSSLRLPIIDAGLDDLVQFAAANALELWGADAAGEEIGQMPVTGPVALVLGNEGAGLSDEVRAACRKLVAIPIRGGAESLNVGVAAGILLYSMTRGLS